MSQVAGGTVGAAVHLVFTAKSLRRDGPHSVFAPFSRLLAPNAFPILPSSQTCTWGMGQHPQEPSSIVQHVEELGHSNSLSGHWTAPKGLVSVDRTTQDSTNTVNESHCPITQGAGGTRACRPSYRGTRGRALGFSVLPGTPKPLSHKPVLVSAIWHRARAFIDWHGIKPAPFGLCPPLQCLALGLETCILSSPSYPQSCPFVQSRGVA